ncbi:MAG: lipid-A-disaccharide synthase [Proteobacteria bacterium]|nr:lipid-A-disaccharide synthase [Pseudomonadota bacterium]
MRYHRLVVIVAGEASADLHGSNLVNAMKGSCPGITFCGIGGKNMAQAGVKILVSSSDMAVVGLTEVVQRLHTIARAASKLKSILKTHHPDLLILIDYPDFNLYMAKIASRLQIPVLYYISPQVWAWRRGRVRKIAKRVDRMAVILPFEERFYKNRGVNVDYVGHPLLDAFESSAQGPKSAARNPQCAARNPVVGLLPGSRKEEITNLLPIMIRSVEIIRARHPGIRCLLPLAKTLKPEFIHSFVRGSSLNIQIHQGDIYDVLSECDVALVTSGTATLETAIMAVPMVVVYKVAPLSYRVGKMLIKVPHIGLVNLVAGERVVPELIQDEVTAERLAEEAFRLLEDARVRENMIIKLSGIRNRLGRGGASERTAEMAIEMMKKM